MVPEHLLGAEGSDQEFTALEKCNRDACNPRGATAHIGAAGGQKAMGAS